MLANPNPVSSAPASRSVREFLAVLSRHNLPHGELDCLPNLLRELHLNKHLAMHFWAAVASLTDKQAATPGTVSASIVEAATGRTPAEVRAAGPAHAAVVDRLERLLAGQDIEPGELANLPAFPRDEPAQNAVQADQPLEEHVLPIRRPRESGRPRRSSRPLIAEPVVPRSESRRLVVLPEPTRAAATVTRVESAPLSSYTEPTSSRIGPAILTLAALLAVGAGGYYVARNGVTRTAERLHAAVAAGYGSAVDTWKGVPAQQTPAPIVDASAATPSSAITPAPAPTSTATSIATPTSAAPVPSAAPPVSSPAAQPVPPAAEKPRTEALTPAQKMAAVAAYNEQRYATPASAAPDGPVVTVPEATMNAQLLVSRVPVVPDGLRGAAGVVRLQANINRDGAVSHLRVLNGPADLQRPALEAVSAWRYRPYMLNGQPVNVSTTVTVDFSSLN